MPPTRVICRNYVEIEGVNVGQFHDFMLKSDYRTLGATAELSLPLYAIGFQKESESSTSGSTRTFGRASARFRRVFDKVPIKVGAEVNVYCWYEGFEKIRVFHGFIEHISEGFPTKLYLRDSTFILRFGAADKAWDSKATTQQIVSDCVGIAQKGFDEERKKLGFERPIAPLTYSNIGKNVQASTTPLSFDNFASGRSPYEIIQYLMQLLVLCAGVTDDNEVYIGAGVADNARPVVKLDTRVNVIGRDIVKVDGRFVDYDVKVTGILSNGRRFTATGGLKTSKTADQKSGFDKVYSTPVRASTLLTTQEGIQNAADLLLQRMKGENSKGSINTLLYPKCQLLDHVDFTDSVFEINSSKFYVIGYMFTANEKGYYQKLQVTDQVLSI